MNIDKRGHWYNYDTKQYDYCNAPQTPNEAYPYIPDIPAARGLFGCYIDTGETVLEAMLKVLTACVGEDTKEQDNG